MKAKIDKNGRLSFDRGFGFKEQFCPFSNDFKMIGNIGRNEQMTCGDRCPHFKISTEFSDYDANKDRPIIIICQGTIVDPDEIIDERKTE